MLVDPARSRTLDFNRYPAGPMEGPGAGEKPGTTH
jgi:hypothetical protein